MAWPQQTLDTLKRLEQIKRDLNEQFVDRDIAVDLLLLAAVCREHLLLIGSPGTAKTQLVTSFTQRVDARCFHYLLTRFTEPTELFGPLDLERFKQGSYHIRTENMLPEAQVAFLDEVFQGSSAILNTLLTLINERIFYNGAQRQHTPLLTLVGASNVLPEDPWLQAFADRFALRLHIEPVADERLEQLIDHGWELELQRIEAARLADQGQQARQAASLKLAELLELHTRLAEVDIQPVRHVYAATVRELRAEGIELTDRRVIKGLKLIAGAALLRRSTVAELCDLWPLNYVWSQPEEAETAKAVIQPKVAEGGGPTLNLARPADEIMEDLNVLQAREDGLRNEVAIGAHLMALNRLRREALRDHRGNTTLQQRVDTLIQHNLQRLEGNSHV